MASAQAKAAQAEATRVPEAEQRDIGQQCYPYLEATNVIKNEGTYKKITTSCFRHVGNSRLKAV